MTAPAAFLAGLWAGVILTSLVWVAADITRTIRECDRILKELRELRESRP